MNKVSVVLASLFLLSGTASASAISAPECVKADNVEVEKLFERWNDALKTGDAKKVADNYLDDAVLLPTMSSQVRLTDAERVDYFEHFLEKKPVGRIDSRTIRTGCNKAIDTGTYSFMFADNIEVSARYTFTYVWTGKDWKISTHHSSAMPEG